MGIRLRLRPDHEERLAAHLAGGQDEQLAFLLADWSSGQPSTIDLRLIEPSAFAVQLPWHLRLGDSEVGAVIRWAHTAGAALVEAHVHRGGGPASFSPSDRAGLGSFVPHVWWRLRHRPYIALIFGESSFDALVWRTGPDDPEQLEALVIGNKERTPTGLSLRGGWGR